MQVDYPPLIAVGTFRSGWLRTNHREERRKETIMSIVSRTIAIALVSTIAAREAEVILQEICDGWRKNNLTLNASNLRRETWGEMIFPICWGRHHNDCRVIQPGENEVPRNGDASRITVPGNGHFLD
jgi:hypothetical protein